MDTREVFVKLQKLSQELQSLTIESDVNIAIIKHICYEILKEIDKLKPDSVSQHVILTKNQAEEYVRKGLFEIEKYNDKVILRSLGNYIDVVRPIQAGLEMILNLNY